MMDYLLSILATTIIQSSFLSSRCLLFFQNENNGLNLISEIPIVNVLVKNGTFEERIVFNYFGCQGIIFYIRTPITTFTMLEETIRRSKERYNQRRYLFLPVANATEEVMAVFNTTAIHFISDLLIANATDNKAANLWSFQYINFKLFTHRFTGINVSNEIVMVNEWSSQNNSFIYTNELFPNKLHNGYGKILRLATFSYKPYSIPDSKDGIELQLALLFCRTYNLTASLLIDETGEWGDIYKNWTGFGIMGNILSDSGDVGLGALYTWENAYVYLDLTKPLVRTGITCLTPAPRLAGGWLVPFLSFTPAMWIAVGLTFFSCSLILFIVEFYISKLEYYMQSSHTKNRIRAFEDSVFYTVAIFVLQSVPNAEIRNKIKMHIYSCLLVFSLLVTTVYSSGLASSMTIPRYVGEIKTVQDLVESGIQWGATSIAWLMSIADAEEIKYRILLERFVSTDENLLKFNNDKRFAFSLERLSAGYYAVGEYITKRGVSNLRLMSEDIYWEHCVLMTRKSSIWTPILDNFILTMAQSGIPSLWEYKAATTYLDSHVQRAIKFSSHHSEGDGSPKKLTLDDVEGLFGLWIIGNAIGILGFLCELVYYHFIKKYK